MNRIILKYPFVFLSHILFVYVFFLTQNVKGQKLSYAILKDSLKKGIYFTFSEFRNNDPSFVVPFTVLEKKRTLTLLQSHDQYEVIFEKVEDTKKKDINSAWGFCDGKNIYVNGERGLSKRNCFEKLIGVGKYCYYLQWNYMNETTMMMSPQGGMTNTPNNSEKKMVIDIVNTSEIELTKEEMLEILTPFPAILAQFKAEKNKKSKYFLYLDKVNQEFK